MIFILDGHCVYGITIGSVDYDTFEKGIIVFLLEHVDNIIQTVDSLSMKANSYNLSTHPRVPAIVAHNNLVKETFLRVKNQLDAMG